MTMKSGQRSPTNGYENGYYEDEDVEMAEPERPSRSRFKLTLPSPSKLVDSTVEGLHRPLVSRVREEDQDVQRARQLLVERNTPSELASLNHPFDIPLPKFRKSASKKEDGEGEEEKDVGPLPHRYAGTLPRSWREQNLITSQRDIDDPEVLKSRQELVKTKSPAELAQFSSLSDFPVPTRIQNVFRSGSRDRSAGKRRHSGSCEPDAPSESWTKSLPRSFKETKLVTNVKECDVDDEKIKRRQELVNNMSPTQLSEIRGFGDFPMPNFKKTFGRSRSASRERRDSRSSSAARSTSANRSWRDQKLVTNVKESDPGDEKIQKRRQLIESRTPGELGNINSIGDFPLPSNLENFFKSSEKKAQDEADKSGGGLNLEDMYSNLPRSLKSDLLVRTKVEEDEEVLKKRQKMVETMKPGELAQFKSMTDFPVPSALENIFKSSEKPSAPPRNGAANRERNKSAGTILTYEGLPEGLKTQLLVSTKENADPELLAERQELVKHKKPSELGNIHGLNDFPLPAPIETLVRPSKRRLKSTKEKQEMKKRSKSVSSLPGDTSKGGWYNSLPRSLTQEVLTRARFEDPEVLKQRQNLVKNKSVSDLAQINSLSEFPLPKFGKGKSKQRSRSASPARAPESMYERLPSSLRSELLVKAEEQDQDLVKQRQELTRTTSPADLAKIGSLNEFPVPDALENLLSKKKGPVPPPRKGKQGQEEEEKKPETLYERLPSGLKTECLVRTKVEADEKVLQERQELARTKSPAELSEIHGLSDFPMPNFGTLKKKKKDEPDRAVEDTGEKTIYDRLPSALAEKNILTKAKVEDPDVQRERAELIKGKSVAELASIGGLSDFPLPTAIESLVGRNPRPVERKKKFREKQRSQSAKSLPEQLYGSLPRQQLLCRAKVENPDVMELRRNLVSSKSIGELSQIHGLSDFPIPATLERLMSKSSKDLSSSGQNSKSKTSLSNISSKGVYGTLPKALTNQDLITRARFEDPEVMAKRRALTESKSVSELAQIHGLSDFPIPKNIERLLAGGSADKKKEPETPKSDDPKEEGLYGTLPRALKSDLLVRSRYEDPEVLKERRDLVQSKSVSELAKVTSLSDFPVPSTFSKVLSGSSKRESRPVSPKPDSGEGMYGSLPRALKTELAVVSKEEDMNEELKQNMELVRSKSPAELGKIGSFSEIPVPRAIENLIGGNQSGMESSKHSKSAHELGGGSLYDTLPSSLKEPLIVTVKNEDPELQQERAELTRSKTPAELAQMRGLSDIPIPGLWTDKSTIERPSRRKKKKEEEEEAKRRSQSEEQGSGFGTMMNKHCVVRCKVEDPEILRQRQELQQSKSIHELSKINNINEIPLPFNIPLPDIPLPKPSKLFKLIARTPKQKPAAPDASLPAEGEGYSPPLSPDKTDDELLRYEASLDGDTTHREQDFGYEVISDQTEAAGDASLMQDDIDIEEDPDSQFPEEFRRKRQQELDEEAEAEARMFQYKGTPERERKPPSRSRGRRSRNFEHPVSATPPPALPPKQPGGRMGDILDDLDYGHDEEEELPAVPVKGILTLEAANGNLHVVKNEYQGSNGHHGIQQDTKRHSGGSFLTEVGYEDSIPSPAATPVAQDDEGGRIQSRPLPAPPAPRRTKRGSASPMKQTMTEEMQQLSQPQMGAQSRSPIPSSEAEHTLSASFHSAAATATSERTLVDSSLARRRQGSNKSTIYNAPWL